MSTTATVTEPLAVSIPEGAVRIGISRAYAWQLAASGQLKTVRIGSRRVVTIEALKQFLAERELGGEDERVAGLDQIPAARGGRGASRSPR
ncbi:MAG: helix-turn-helix domain-containing protein [Candidatus Dormibacteria bacterium]